MPFAFMGAAPKWIGMILIIVGVWGIATNAELSDPATWGVPLFVGLLGGFLLLSPFLSTRQAFRTSAMLRDPFSGKADAMHVMIESSIGRSDIVWSKFFRARITPELVLLYVSAQQFYVLARQFFNSDQEWSEFQALVTERVPVKRAGRSFGKSALLWFSIVVGTFILWSLWRSLAP